jgi:iron complex transport system substrate-binding protein
MNRSWIIALALLIALTASISTLGAGADFTLGIFGNANMDDTIDEMDVTYVEGIINGTNAATNLSDANYDGKIDAQDIDQIKKVIANEEKALTIKDTLGRVVTVKMPVERVALLNKYCVDAIQIFGVQDRIIGVETEAKEYTYLPKLSSLPALGKAGDPDLEAIVSLNPDLLITWFSTKVPDLEKGLPKSIPIIDLSFSKPENLIRETKTLGYIFGKNDKADDYIDNFHDKYVDLIKSRTEKLPEKDRPKVYTECNVAYKTYGNTTGAHQMIVLAGGKNIFDDTEGIPTVDPEAIIDKDPAVILRGAYSDAGYNVDNSSKMKELRDEIMKRPGFDKITAVKNKKVYIDDVTLNYGLSYPIALVYFAKFINPKLFEDINPQAVHQEYLTDFLDIDYDLNKHGVSVYPPLNES